MMDAKVCIWYRLRCMKMVDCWFIEFEGYYKTYDLALEAAFKRGFTERHTPQGLNDGYVIDEVWIVTFDEHSYLVGPEVTITEK